MGDRASEMTTEAAVYCRVAHRWSPGQVGLDEREAECRAAAVREGIRVAPRRVFLDPQAASWTSAAGSRPGWEGLLRELASGQVTHAAVYDLRELERFRPQDLARLLALAARHDLVLLDPVAPGHGADVNQPEHRRAVLERAGAAGLGRRRRADSVRAAQADEASSGRPHGGGRRAYGYTPGDYDLIPEEADVVARIYDWFLAGRSLSSIARELTAELIPTAAGGRWTSTKVARIIDAPRYAGLRVRTGQILCEPDGAPVLGRWKPCVSQEDWEAARVLRESALQNAQDSCLTARHYPLTGLVRCGRCGRRMVGSAVAEYRNYACTGRRASGQEPCFRYISATRLEELVDQQILDLLADLDPQHAVDSAPAAVLDRWRTEARRHDQTRLVELPENDPAATRERAEVTARIRAENRAVVLRAPGALADLLPGRDPCSAWRRMPPAQQAEVRRCLIERIEIGPVTGPRSVFDPDRVRIVPHTV